MHETELAVHVFVLLLLIASGVAMLAKRVQVPYTLLLVIVGIAISPMHFLPPVHVSPELILLIFLPALLFEAAWNLKWSHLKENLAPILLLATFGVGISVAVIGATLHLGGGFEWSTALLFGSMIAATDPVSVLSIFRKLGLPGRLTTIVEGESLFNDGTSVVVFRILLGLSAGAAAMAPPEIALHSAREFAIVVLGGIAVGAIAGIIASTLTSYFDDHLLEITLTTIAAYGPFLLAETLEVSGVIAVLVSGLILGNVGRSRGMSPTTQVSVNSFWEYAAFVVNSLVFLLIGLEIHLDHIMSSLQPIGWAIVAMLLGRIASVYGLAGLFGRWIGDVPFKWQHVLLWGGLRGSLSIALVLSLPTDTPMRSTLVTMIFGAVVFSLLFQGLTISPLLRWLGLAKAGEKLTEYELVHARLLAETAALAELDSLRKRGMVTLQSFQALQEQLSSRQAQLAEELNQKGEASRDFEQARLMRLQRYLIDKKKARLAELYQDRVISEESYGLLTHELNESLAHLGGGDH